ncbi:MAG: hypothetical protein QM770_09880 [Tepidisphaeraceae bacterium]
MTASWRILNGEFGAWMAGADRRDVMTMANVVSDYARRIPKKVFTSATFDSRSKQVVWRDRDASIDIGQLKDLEVQLRSKANGRDVLR